MLVECIRFHAYERGVMKGFCVLKVDDFIFDGCSLCEKNGGRWINFPSKETKEEDGSVRWRAYVRFEEKDKKEQFNKLAIKAIDAFIANPPQQQQRPQQQPQQQQQYQNQRQPQQQPQQQYQQNSGFDGF